MPIVDIKCNNNECKHVKEVLVKNTSELPVCEKCGSKTERILSAPKGFLTLGDGFYNSGYSHSDSHSRKNK